MVLACDLKAGLRLTHHVSRPSELETPKNLGPWRRVPEVFHANGPGLRIRPPAPQLADLGSSRAWGDFVMREDSGV